MSQGSTILPVVGTITGLQEQGYINTALAALRSNNSGAAAPSADTPVQAQFWYDNNLSDNHILKMYDGADWIEIWRLIASTNRARTATLVTPRGFWSGGDLSNNVSDATNDIDFAPGAMVDSTGAYLMENLATMTKRLDATFAAGTNQGGRASAVSLSTSTWYHCYMIRNDTTGAVDYYFDTSASAANKPAGYTHFRRRGSIYRDSGGVIKAFTNLGNKFWWNVPSLDLNAAPGVSATWTAWTLLTPVGFVTIPFGLFQNGSGSSGQNGLMNFRTPSAGDQLPNSGPSTRLSGPSTGSGDTMYGQWSGIRTNTSSQLEYWSSATTPHLSSMTRGWEDPLP